MNIPTALRQAHLYDKYDRNNIKLFLGEWATNAPVTGPRFGDTPIFAYALADAAWLTGLERNADVVMMNSYAPLFVNVNPGGRQWAVNLIGYDVQTSFGSPSYYVQKMYSRNRGDVVLSAKIDGIPILTADQIPAAVNPNPPTPRGGAAATGTTTPPAPPPVDGIYVSATRDTPTGDVILKLVNIQTSAQMLQINLEGVANIRKDASGEIITGDLGAINTVTEPMNVVPKPISIGNASTKFTHELPARSVSVLRLKTK
jgi:alpha-N-arabinofuranosidase